MLYALRVSQEQRIPGHTTMAYDVCNMAASCIVWRHDRDATFDIHLVWASK
jgi:hypothetical protein